MQQPAGVVVRPAIKHVPRSVVRDAHEGIVRCGLGIVQRLVRLLMEHGKGLRAADKQKLEGRNRSAESNPGYAGNNWLLLPQAQYRGSPLRPCRSCCPRARARGVCNKSTLRKLTTTTWPFGQLTQRW